MTTAERNLIAARLLISVYRTGAYSTLELNKTLAAVADERNRAYISRLFYGVLSKDVQLDYIVSRLASKRPRVAAAVVIKCGLYMLRYMSEPDYAVIDAQVGLMDKLGKGELKGFVNAVLRRSKEIVLPLTDGDEITRLSVNHSFPAWLTKKLIDEYGREFTVALLEAELTDKTHVRANTSRISDEELVAVSGGERTKGGCYLTRKQLEVLAPGEYFVQSLASVLAARYYAAGIAAGDEVLDLCAAPGGKAVYVAQKTGAHVTACDIHPHRVELIKDYAKRAAIDMRTLVNDATKPCAEFFGRFDCVICDVPCSGVGVYKSKPDVLIGRTEADIASLCKLQRAILSAAAAYVKKGGALNYSTCTILKEENEDAIADFLRSHADFTVERASVYGAEAGADGFVRLYPHTDGCDGFFVAKLRRNK